MVRAAGAGGAVPYAVFRSAGTLLQFLKDKTTLNSRLVADVAERARSGENFGRVLALPTRELVAIMHELVQTREDVC